MKIAIIGWGSLVWDQRELPINGGWEKGGPILAVEFSRISRGGRLTLVIDEAHGEEVCTRYAISRRTELAPAMVDLQTREDLPSIDRVGFVDVLNNQQSARAPEVCECIRTWAADKGFDAAVWTALGRRFRDAIGGNFSAHTALDYVEGLDAAEQEEAFKYIRNAPEEVQTPFRRLFNQHHPI